ncbi:MAG: hypothetical protein U0I22_06995 [Treponema sp.]|nr:hypothetical protein [Treponema sp.]
MKNPSWKDKLQYWFDNLMSKGSLSLIGLLAVITGIVIAIAGCIVALLPDAEGAGVLSSIWFSLMHAIDAGTIAGDSGSFLFMLIMAIVTLCGLFITSMLIGVIGSGLEDKMNSLRKGRSQVLEQNHVIIFGFNENALNILRELILANENHKNSVVVVMDNQDKSEMEDTIAQRIQDTKTTRIICRTGSMDNLADVEICSPSTCRSIIINAEDDFMSVKAILACATILENSGNTEAYITALIRSEENVDAAKIAGKGRVEVFYFQNSIARIMAHTCRQPGMSSVFTNLLSFEGDEIYIEEIPSMAGKTIAEANLYFPKSTLIGLVQDGMPKLNPPVATKIAPQDKLILIAQDDGVSIPTKEAGIVNKSLFAPIASSSAILQKTLILGCNELLQQVVTELDCYLASNAPVIIAALEEDLSKNELPEQGQLKNVALDIRSCDIFQRSCLEELLASKPDNVLILTDSDNEESDARTLLLLLQLRDIAAKTGLKFSVTSEMRSVENQELAQVTKVTDFVVSSNITALMMTQISQAREQFVILDDLLSDDGSELYMKDAGRYVKLGESVDFYTIGAAATQYGEIALGYKKFRDDGEFDIVLNPSKSSTVILSKGDSLILLAEN